MQAIRAVREEVVQSPISESARDSETVPSSSSKLVLVVGGTGGVGMAFWSFCSLLSYAFEV